MIETNIEKIWISFFSIVFYLLLNLAKILYEDQTKTLKSILKYFRKRRRKEN